MQIVIEIDDNLYTRLFDNGVDYTSDMRRACVAIRNGTPLLEQQPCEDCISRNQAILATYGFERYTGIDEAPIEYVGTILRNLPSVTPKPIIGRWLEVIENTDSLGRKKNWHYKCSICGNEDSGWGEYNYCPICGAEMKGV